MALNTGTYYPNDEVQFDKFRPTRISGISGKELNRIADSVSRLSQANPRTSIVVELVLGVLDNDLPPNGTVTMTVDVYDPLTDTFVPHSNDQPQVRDYLKWDVSAGKRVACMKHTQSGLLIPIAAEC